LVCYIQKYVIILGGDIPVDVPPTKILGDVSPASTTGLTPVLPMFVIVTGAYTAVHFLNFQPEYIGSISYIQSRSAR